MTAELNVPKEYINDIITMVINNLKVRKAMPEDIVNDGVDKA